MYGHEIGQAEAYYGPPAPGQSWGEFQSQMSAFVPIGAALMLVNPLVGAAVLLGGLLTSGGPSHMNKPKIQGG
jgi:hypothetical protein